MKPLFEQITQCLATGKKRKLIRVLLIGPCNTHMKFRCSPENLLELEFIKAHFLFLGFIFRNLGLPQGQTGKQSSTLERSV